MQLGPAPAVLLLLLHQHQSNLLHCVGAAVVSGQGLGLLGQAAGHCNIAADDAVGVDAVAVDAVEDDAVAEDAMVAADDAVVVGWDFVHAAVAADEAVADGTVAAAVGTASVVALCIAAAVVLGWVGKIFVVFAASAETAYRSHIPMQLPAILHAAEDGWQHRLDRDPGAVVPQGLDHGELAWLAVAAGSFVEGQQRGRKSGPAEPEILLARDVVLEKPHALSVRPALHPGAS